MTAGIPRPTVSIVIPCFNQACFLAAAVESARRQTYPALDLIVVDDGSTDGTAAEARRLGVPILRQPNRGVSEARNAGLAAVRGECVVMLDADDELLPEATAVGADAMAANPHAAMVVGLCQSMDVDGQPLPTRHHPVDCDNLYREWLTSNFAWTPGAAMFRRDALARAGGFPPQLGGAADYAVYLLFARSGRALHHRREVVRYRQHDASMSRDPALMLRQTLEVLRREQLAAPAHFRGDFRRARRAWCSWYGEQIPDYVRAEWQAGRGGWPLMASLWTFVHRCPGLAVRRGALKLARTVGALRSAPRPERLDDRGSGRSAR